MRVLLDENLPRRLKGLFSAEMEVITVPEPGWSGMKNGELLTLAVNEFDVFVTVEAGIEYQQNLAGFMMRISVRHARTNRLADLEPLMPEVNAKLPTVVPSQVADIGI